MALSRMTGKKEINMGIDWNVLGPGILVVLFAIGTVINAFTGSASQRFPEEKKEEKDE